MEEKVSESVLRTLASEYCTKVMSKLVQGTINEKLDVLELDVVRRFNVSEGDGNKSVSIHFTIESDDVEEVLGTVSRYLDNQDVYWDGSSFRIRDHDNKVNAVVEDLREKINTLYKERYQSEFETVSSLNIDRSNEDNEDNEGIEFPDTLTLLTHSLMLNAKSKLGDLEKQHGITGKRGLLLLANLIIDSEINVQFYQHDNNKFLELTVDYHLLDSDSKPVLMAKYRNNYGVVYPNGTCKLNQEQIDADLEDMIRKIKNEMLINLN